MRRYRDHVHVVAVAAAMALRRRKFTSEILPAKAYVLVRGPFQVKQRLLVLASPPASTRVAMIWL